MKAMIYCYWVSMGLASLHKIAEDGSDIAQTPKKIGKFKTDAEAKDACERHYQKACKLAANSGRVIPEICWC